MFTLNLAIPLHYILPYLFGYILSPKDWNHKHAMVECLDFHVEFLYSSLALPQRYKFTKSFMCFYCSIEHSNNYLGATLSSTLINHTREAQQVVHKKCLKYLIKHKENSKSSKMLNWHVP